MDWFWDFGCADLRLTGEEMKRIYEAFVLMIVRWLSPAPKEDELTDEVCWCDHHRGSHDSGKFKCRGKYAPTEEYGEKWKDIWLGCSCQVFIPRGRRGGGDDTKPDPDPSEKEIDEVLKKL